MDVIIPNSQAEEEALLSPYMLEQGLFHPLLSILRCLLQEEAEGWVWIHRQME